MTSRDKQFRIACRIERNICQAHSDERKGAAARVN